jgi:hypothetical protein
MAHMMKMRENDKEQEKGKEANNMRKRKTESQMARQQYRKANINNETKQEENTENKKMVPRAAGLNIPGLIPGAVTPCSHLQNTQTGTRAQRTAFAIGERGDSRGTKRPGLQSDYFPLSGVAVKPYLCSLYTLRCMKKATSTFVNINNCCIHSLIGNVTGITCGKLLVHSSTSRSKRCLVACGWLPQSDTALVKSFTPHIVLFFCIFIFLDSKIRRQKILHRMTSIP